MKLRTLRQKGLEKGLSQFCRKWKITELGIFGSFLRDDFHNQSDIDILVDFEPDAQIGFLALARIQRELGVIFGRPVDLVPKLGLKPAIRDEVLAGAYTLYAH